MTYHGQEILTASVSPAQVQNFLQGCRGDPLKALNEIDAWVEKTRGGEGGATRASNRTSDTSASFVDPVNMSRDLGDESDLDALTLAEVDM
jgi:chaperone BCS1